jgi:hypothetical protein
VTGNELQRVLDRLAGALDAEPAGAPFAAALRGVDASAAAPAGDGRGGPAGVALPHVLSELAPALAWTQTAGYVADPPSPDFLTGYGYAVLCGPRGGAPPLVASEELACGVLVLGPGVLYPAHAHPAVEAYVPLTTAAWQRGGGAWRERPPCSVVVHGPREPHAMRAGREALVALYVWLGDLVTPARLL